ncbi:MAG: hypothetical protein AVDCRST_MAG90-1148, partial [uncultured Microvirga sp.]
GKGFESRGQGRVGFEPGQGRRQGRQEADLADEDQEPQGCGLAERPAVHRPERQDRGEGGAQARRTQKEV